MISKLNLVSKIGGVPFNVKWFTMQTLCLRVLSLIFTSWPALLVHKPVKSSCCVMWQIDQPLTGTPVSPLLIPHPSNTNHWQAECVSVTHIYQKHLSQNARWCTSTLHWREINNIRMYTRRQRSGIWLPRGLMLSERWTTWLRSTRSVSLINPGVTAVRCGWILHT